ncbi:ABC transporter substrate-binding protein [Spartinivicinus ruber]|uniref:ABC transporter substrate-binding protein n=1 Tax=Spartinivicinus ruber TaxID=2683272 RepID=UPI0013D28EA6|nr:ABC transporter substrate-binding protein [Spartinivicinus ruber]
MSKGYVATLLRFSLVVFLFVVSSFAGCSFAIETLRLGVGLITASGKARAGVTEVIKRFEKQYPEAKVELITLYDEEFKSATIPWLKKAPGKNVPDIFFGSAGERLFNLVRKNYVQDITDIWQQQKLDQVFSAGIKATVSLKAKVYAIPFAYYQWGFYYNSAILAKYNLPLPNTWQQFLDICYTLKKHNIYCIGIGTKEHWPAAGWFDYLNLRLNGLGFHHELTKGCIAYTHPSVLNVFTHWAELVNQNFYEPGATSHNWKLVFPTIYRGKTAFTLIGNFAESLFGKIPSKIKKNIKFVKFPEMTKNMPIYEDATTDIFFLSKVLAHKRYAKAFMAFLATKQVQELLTGGLSMIPVNRHAKPKDTYFLKEGKQLLDQAAGYAQFYDRDTPKNMANNGIWVFSQFFEDGNIKNAITHLEEARK